MGRVFEEKGDGMMDLIKAILHTAGKTDEEIRDIGDFILPEEIPAFREIFEAWDGAEVYVAKAEHIGPEEYALIGWDEKDCEIDRKIKEATYLMEQDPLFGTYIGERERFETDWNEGEYEPGGSISFKEKDIEIIEETPAQRLARLILKYPELPVIPMVDWEVCASDGGRWMASVGKARIAEYMWKQGEYGDPVLIYRHQANELVDAMTEEAEIHTNTEADAEKERVYNEARQQAWKKISEMEWKKALFVEIDLPEEA